MKILKGALIISGIVCILTSIYLFISREKETKSILSILFLGIFAVSFGFLIDINKRK